MVKTDIVKDHLWLLVIRGTDVVKVFLEKPIFVQRGSTASAKCRCKFLCGCFSFILCIRNHLVCIYRSCLHSRSCNSGSRLNIEYNVTCIRTLV